VGGLSLIFLLTRYFGQECSYEEQTGIVIIGFVLAEYIRSGIG
jgi:hypothetical protein